MDGTLSQYVAVYAAGRLSCSARTLQQYRIAVGRLNTHAGREVLLSELSAQLVIGWLRTYLDSPSTGNSKRQAVLTLWRSAAEAGLAPVVPKIPVLLEPDTIPVVWELSEIERLWAAVDSVPGYWGDVPAWLGWRIGLGCLWDTGCRIGELLLANLSDVWLDKGKWFSPARNRKGKRADKLYTLHPETLTWIRQSLDCGERERLFPFPQSRRMLWVRFREILTAAGLPADRLHQFHCLRRTVESHAAAARGVAWAAEAIGHSEEVARRHYVSPLVAPGPALIDALPRPCAVPKLRVV